jgi:hypothetical protein
MAHKKIKIKKAIYVLWHHKGSVFESIMTLPLHYWLQLAPNYAGQDTLVIPVPSAEGPIMCEIRQFSHCFNSVVFADGGFNFKQKKNYSSAVFFYQSRSVLGPKRLIYIYFLNNIFNLKGLRMLKNSFAIF